MTRAQWVANYREHRKADRLWSFMQGAFDDGVPSFVTAVDGRFDRCRLSGDVLGRFKLAGVLGHKCRMYDLSLRVSLPA